MKKKYKFTKETVEVNGRKLHRIKAVRSFGLVQKGDLGGFIENENNLSHEGNAWVFCEAMVFGNARIYGNAKVYDSARIHDNAKVYGNANICGNAWVYDNVKVFDDAWIFDNVMICDDAKIYGNANICDSAVVRENAEIYDKTIIYGNALINGNAKIHGEVGVCGLAEISENADIFKEQHYLVVGPCGNTRIFITFYRDTDREISVSGGFKGKMDDLIKEYDGELEHEIVHQAAELAKKQIDLSSGLERESEKNEEKI